MITITPTPTPSLTPGIPNYIVQITGKYQIIYNNNSNYLLLSTFNNIQYIDKVYSLSENGEFFVQYKHGDKLNSLTQIEPLKYYTVVSNTYPYTLIPGNPVPITPSPTPIPTRTPTVTPSITVSPSITPSITVSPSITPSITVSPSITLTKTTTPTVTPSITNTPGASRTPTPTPTLTPTLSPVQQCTGYTYSLGGPSNTVYEDAGVTFLSFNPGYNDFFYFNGTDPGGLPSNMLVYINGIFRGTVDYSSNRIGTPFCYKAQGFPQTFTSQFTTGSINF